MVILFDLDDTLIEHTRAARLAVVALFDTHGATLGLALDEFTARWAELTEQAMDAFARGELTVVEQRRLRVRKMFDAQLDDGRADAIYARYLDVYQRSWRLYDDVLPCFDKLAAHRLGIVSNGGHDQQHRKLKATGIAHRFEIVLTPAPPMRGKPAPDMFFAAAAAMGAHPRDCLYVGDHLERDVLAAERAGMSAVWLRRGDVVIGDALADVHATILRSLAELHSLL